MRNHNERISQIDRDMYHAGVDRSIISRAVDMLQHQDGHWVTVYLYDANQLKRFVGTETLRTDRPYKDQMLTAIERGKTRFGCDVVICHERL